MACLIGVFVAVFTAVVLEVRVIVDAIINARHTAHILRELARQDPPDNSANFYAIQIPVEESNMGKAFTPKTPAQLRSVDDLAKLKVVRMLTLENEKVNWPVPATHNSNLMTHNSVSI